MGRQRAAVVEFYLFGHVFHNVYHTVVASCLHATLGVEAELDGLAYDHSSRGGAQLLGDDVQQGAFAHAVGPDNADLLAAFEYVAEVGYKGGGG